MNIESIPEGLIFVGNLKDISLTKIDTKNVPIQLYETGKPESPILNEIYIPDANKSISIEIKSVIIELLATEIPPLNTFTTTIVPKSYTLAIYNTYTYSFSVINGGMDQDEDMATFFRHNFLTWQQGFRQVSPESLLFLAYVAQEDCFFKLAVCFENNNISEIVIALSENEFKSFNLSPQYLNVMFNQKVISCEAWIEACSGYYLTEKVVYRLTEPDNAKIYFYMNSLGGIDTIMFTGAFSMSVATKTDLSIYREKWYENKIELTRTYKQNTGYITSEESVFVTDFLLSKSRFFVSGDKLIPIIIEESENEFIINELNAFEFEYKLARQSAYLHLPHKEGFTPEQLPPFWDKVGACFDQKKGNKIIDRTHGYIATLSDDGMYIDFPILIPDIFRRQNTTFWLADIPAYDTVRRWKISELSGTFTINYASDLCSETLFFRDIINGTITSVLPIIVYKNALTETEIAEVLKYLDEYYFLETPPAFIVNNIPVEGNNTFLTDNSTLK